MARSDEKRVIVVEVESGFREEFDAEARRDQRTRSSAARAALEQWLERRRTRAAPQGDVGVG